MKKSDRNHGDLLDENFEKVLEYMTTKHRRVLPIRNDHTFEEDFHQDGYNREFCEYHKRLVQHYRDRGVECRFFSVREQGTSMNPHYHDFIFLDGDKCWSVMAAQKVCNRIWKDVLNVDTDGLVDFCLPEPSDPVEPLRMIERPSRKVSGEVLKERQKEFDNAKDIARQHATYLTKTAGKGSAPHRRREVFTSHVRLKKAGPKPGKA